MLPSVQKLTFYFPLSPELIQMLNEYSASLEVCISIGVCWEGFMDLPGVISIGTWN